ncbi:MAG: histidinol dehydrogenase, partial [Candidatus Methanospirareceae archaeon]
MKIRIYELGKLRGGDLERLKRRSEMNIERLIEEVEPIIEEVREEGDEAVRRYEEKFDDVRLGSLKVEEEEISKAYERVSEEVIEALKRAYSNIKKFHTEQLERFRFRFTEIAPGIIAGEKITPIESVGLYVPRGKGSFPSVMLMLGVPAKVAGVRRIVVCTPPQGDGSIDAATLIAADLCSIKHIFKVGGVQAIAAMAYGTETIPKVDKIVGPGSSYVAAAKRILYGVIDVG